jgi:hypothetical protein
MPTQLFDMQATSIYELEIDVATNTVIEVEEDDDNDDNA